MRKPMLLMLFWSATAASLAAALWLLIARTPDEVTMGVIQKIFYLHLPVAINAFIACFTVFVASVGYLATRETWWDDLGAAAAKVAVLLCSIVLLTGMIWGKSAWGAWWAWTPRLTFSLALWLLYVVYLMIRASLDSEQRRAIVGAVYGIVAFLDVPLVYLSARLIPDPLHPPTIGLDPGMKLTLAVWFIPVTLLTAALIVMRYHLNRAQRAAEHAAAAPATHGFPVRLVGDSL